MLERQGKESLSMKIIKWNIRGSRSADKRRSIKRLLCRVNPDLVVLQEVKRAVADRQLIGSLWKSRFKEWVLLLGIGKSGGILVIWDVRSVRVIDSLIGDFSVSVLIEDEKEKWWFTGVYGPNSHSSRGLFWDELAGLSSICGNKWCRGRFQCGKRCQREAK